MHRQDLLAIAIQTIKCIERDSASSLTERQISVIIHWLVRCMEDANNSSVDKLAAKMEATLLDIKNMKIKY